MIGEGKEGHVMSIFLVSAQSSAYPSSTSISLFALVNQLF